MGIRASLLSNQLFCFCLQRRRSSGGDSSDNNSDAGAVSGGDSPQRATWDAQRDARRTSYPTRGRAQRDRRERENENKSSE
jgi:hypothetical protein